MAQCLLSSAKFSVERRVYAQPQGKTHHYDVVVHPGAVVILPVLADGRIVLIRNHRYTVEEELWELPAGTMEPDESPVETAKRELEEEAGYSAGRLTLLAEYYTSPGFTTELMRAYLATELS